MKIHTNFENFGKIKNPVVTTGTFDGVHIGHKFILDRLASIAQSIDGESVLITFQPHPRKILFPNKCQGLQLINSQEEKTYLFKKSKIDHLFIINFTLDFAKTTSIDFINNILLKKLNIHTIIVGFNHHFGHNREGDYSYLYELSKTKNFSVEEIPELDIEHEAVSSSRIRKALIQGHIQRANAYLDHFYIIIGKVILSDRFPSNYSNPVYELKISEPEKLIPPVGSYAISVNQEQSHAMAIILRDKDDKTKVFLLCLDNSCRIHSNSINTINFHKKISENYNLDKTDFFVKQISKDIVSINELIF